MRNIIAVPCYYSGTSFEEIAGHMSNAVKKLNFPVYFIGHNKPLKNDLRGSLLDDKQYIHFQFKLINELTKVREDSKILFLDFFNPGLDLLKYDHEQKGIKVKYGSFLHGGTFFEGDIYKQPWLGNFELAWASIYDTIYVASNYAKNKLPDKIRLISKVLPWGLDNFSYNITSNKKYDVIFPHRLNADKGIEDFIKIAHSLPRVNFVVTSPQAKEIVQQNPYYKELKKYPNISFILGKGWEDHNLTLSHSKIVLSCAKQETFGYSIIKSALAGCIPVLPSSQCYPEFFKKEFMFSTVSEARKKIQKILVNKTRLASKKIFCNIGAVNNFSFSSHFCDFFKN